MRHIKKYNESDIEDGVQIMVDNYLSYLIDSGFECYVNGNKFNTHISIAKKDRSRFTFNEVADDFIPFIKILNNEYRIAYNNTSFTGCEPMRKLSEYNRVFTIDEIVNERLPKNTSCNSICIQINGLRK